MRQKHDGYLNNIADDSFCDGDCEDTDEQDTWGVRLHVLLEPTESTDVLFTMQYHWDDGGVGQTRLDDVSFSPLGNPSDPRDIRNDLETTLDMEAKLYTLRVDQGLGDWLGGMHLSAFISRQEQDWTQVVDNDFTEQPFAYTAWTEPSDQWVGEIQRESINDQIPADRDFFC